MHWYFFRVRFKPPGKGTIVVNYYGTCALEGFITLTERGYTVLKCNNYKDHD